MNKFSFRLISVGVVLTLCVSTQVFSQETESFDLPSISDFDNIAAPVDTPKVEAAEVPSSQIQSESPSTPEVTTPSTSTQVEAIPSSITPEESITPNEPSPVVEDIPVQNTTTPIVEQNSSVSSESPSNCTSNSSSNGWAVNVSGGSNLFYGDLRVYPLYPVSGYHNERKWAVSCMLEKQLQPNLDIRGQYLYGTLSGTRRNYSNGSPALLYFDANIHEFSSNIKLNISNAIIGEEKPLSLYGYTGIGFVLFRTQQKHLVTNAVLQSYGYNGNEKTTPTIETMVPIGGGLDYKINDNISVNLDVSIRVVNTDKLDATISGGDGLLQDMYGYTSIGLTYKLGCKKSKTPPVSAQEQMAPIDVTAIDSAVVENIDTVATVQNTIVETLPDLNVTDVESVTFEPAYKEEPIISNVRPAEEPVVEVAQPSISKSDLVFKVQILAVQNKNDDKVFTLKKMFNLNEVISEDKIDGWFKYSVGSFSSIEQALLYRQQLQQKGINDGFIIAVYQGKRITLQQAREILAQ